MAWHGMAGSREAGRCCGALGTYSRTNRVYRCCLCMYVPDQTESFEGGRT